MKYMGHPNHVQNTHSSSPPLQLFNLFWLACFCYKNTLIHCRILTLHMECSQHASQITITVFVRHDSTCGLSCIYNVMHVYWTCWVFICTWNDMKWLIMTMKWRLMTMTWNDTTWDDMIYHDAWFCSWDWSRHSSTTPLPREWMGDRVVR